MTFNLAAFLIVLLLSFQNLYLRLGQYNALWSTDIFSKAFSRFFMAERLWPSQMACAPDGDKKMPGFRSSLLALTWT